MKLETKTLRLFRNISAVVAVAIMIISVLIMTRQDNHPNINGRLLILSSAPLWIAWIFFGVAYERRNNH